MNELITLDQRAFKINFHLQQGAAHFIEAGQELIDAKKEVPHGEWYNWLEKNCKLKKSAANNLMNVASRFGANLHLNGDLNFTQMVALLALPEGEETAFINAQKEKGAPVENQTVKQLREEIQTWKARTDEEKAKVENLFADLRQTKEENRRLQSANTENSNRAAKAEAKMRNMFADLEKVKAQNSALRTENSNLKQNPPTVEPADYRQLQKAKVELQSKITNLQKQLANKQVEVVTPADYEQTKKELARLQAEQSEMVQRMEVYQNLGTVAALMDSIIKSPSLAGVQDFKREHPDDFGKMCAAMLDFTDSFYEE